MNYLVVGLGNIGPEYVNTRHNIGFIVLDAWAQASNIVFKTDRYGDVAQYKLKGRTFNLLKPSTYMNLSGKAVDYWMKKLNIPIENIVVVVDDLALPLGTFRMRKKGSAGGHNGLANINDCLGSDAYTRIRIGIGSDFSKGAQVDYVLGKFSAEDMEKLKPAVEKTIEAVKAFALVGVDRAMNQYNAK